MVKRRFVATPFQLAIALLVVMLATIIGTSLYVLNVAGVMAPAWEDKFEIKWSIPTIYLVMSAIAGLILVSGITFAFIFREERDEPNDPLPATPGPQSGQGTGQQGAQLRPVPPVENRQQGDRGQYRDALGPAGD